MCNECAPVLLTSRVGITLGSKSMWSGSGSGSVADGGTLLIRGGGGGEVNKQTNKQTQN